MKKLIYIWLVLGITACNQRPQTTTSFPDSAENRLDSVMPNTEPALKDGVEKKGSTEESKKDAVLPAKIYSNKRFREVTVEKSTEDTYSIQGKGQIFEANFGWVVEDGHNEIKTGHQTTDAGAPEWGNFKFSVAVKKPRPNSHITLILFELSAMDGSRQHILPIPLK